MRNITVENQVPISADWVAAIFQMLPAKTVRTLYSEEHGKA